MEWYLCPYSTKFLLEKQSLVEWRTAYRNDWLFKHSERVAEKSEKGLVCNKDCDTLGQKVAWEAGVMYSENKKRSAVEVAMDRIIQFLQDNRLGDHDKLPSERELCQLLNVGRSTLREAIQRLAARNVLEVRRGAGTFVSYKHGVADDPLGFTLIRDQRRLAMDLLEFRIMVEPSIAAMAAQNASKDDIKELEFLCLEVEELLRRGKPHHERDKEFHACIARCSGNMVMPKIQPIIHGSIGLFIRETGGQLKEETIRTHRAILNAIRAKDGVAAWDAMYLHLVYNRDKFRSDSIVKGGSYGDKTE